MRRIRTIALGAALIAAACGGAAASPEPTTTAPAKTAAAATLAPAAPTAATVAPAATPASTASSGSGVLALGKKVYETAGDLGCIECHQASGRGGKTAAGDTAPDIRGATLTKAKDALSGGVGAMSFIKLSEQEIAAVVAYLDYLNGLP